MAIPSKLTHEEQALLNRFSLLKKLKKEVTPLKVNTKNSQVKPVKKPAAKQEKAAVAEKVKIKTAPAEDVKEKAKQLIASGKIKLQNKDKRSFKRAKALQGEKKIKPSEGNSFSTNEQNKKKIENIKKDSYNNFVSGHNQTIHQAESPTKREFKKNNFDRRQGNCLFVQGHGLTKQILDTEFLQFGKISSIYMETDRNHGTVTFETKESAEKAIKELHGSMVQGVILRVMYSRKRTYDDNRFTYRTKAPKIGAEQNTFSDFDKQPHDDASEDTRSETSGGPGPKRKTGLPEKRQLVTYENDDDFF